MHIKIPYKGSQSEAVTKVKGALDQGRSQFKDKVVIHEEKWEGNTLNFDITAEGQHISGTLEVVPGEFVLDAKLPFMMRLFEGRIEKEIAEQVKKMM
jgi:hypothetical protein